MSAHPSPTGAAPTPVGPDAWDAHAARMRQRFGGSASKPGSATAGAGLVQHPMVAPSPSLATRRGNAFGLFSSKLHSAAPSAAASPRDTGLQHQQQRAHLGGQRGGGSMQGGAVEGDNEGNESGFASAPPDRSTHALAASETASSARTGALAAVRREAARLAAEVGVESARRREADASLAAERAAHVAEVSRLTTRVAELEREVHSLRLALTNRALSGPTVVLPASAAAPASRLSTPAHHAADAAAAASAALRGAGAVSVMASVAAGQQAASQGTTQRWWESTVGGSAPGNASFLGASGTTNTLLAAMQAA